MSHTKLVLTVTNPHPRSHSRRAINSSFPSDAAPPPRPPPPPPPPPPPHHHRPPRPPRGPPVFKVFSPPLPPPPPRPRPRRVVRRHPPRVLLRQIERVRDPPPQHVERLQL